MAANLIDAISGDLPVEEQDPTKNPNAVALGRLGGLKGGRARAEKLSAKKRKEIARKAAVARWKRPQQQGLPSHTADKGDTAQ